MKERSSQKVDEPVGAQRLASCGEPSQSATFNAFRWDVLHVTRRRSSVVAPVDTSVF